jgi:hypothetical protein
MPRREELALAVRLDRILDGREPSVGEAGALAAVLERVAAPARFEVDPAEVERAVERALRGVVRARSRVWRPAAAAGLAAAAVAATIVALVLTRTSPIHVEGRALAALGGPATVLHVIERIEPARPGAFPSSVRTGWIDSSGAHVRWTQYVNGRRVAVTLLERGRVSTYVPAENVVVVGTSCRAFASGCAALVDPVQLYRRALQRGEAHAKRTEYEGRPAYVLALPVQDLPDAVRISQRVTIDRQTYLPRRIEWVEQRPGGAAHAFSIIRIVGVRRVPAAGVRNVFQITAFGARVVQRVAPGRNLRKLGERRLTLDEAKRLRPPLLWLGPDYFGQPVTAIDEVRWNAGIAHRIRYGALTLWNFGALIPPEIAANRYTYAKDIPLPGGGIVRFYQARDGRVVAERERADRSVAIIGAQFGKESFYDALRRVFPLK